MTQLLLRADDVLRRRPWKGSVEHPLRTLATLLTLIFAFGMLYGAVMGSFGGLGPDRLRQILFSALKMPLLLLASFAISLPSFFVVNNLLGLGGDIRASLRALIATQAGVTIVLAALAPMTAFWYLSSRNYEQAIVFNMLVFAAASAAGQLLLRGYYRPLIQRNAKHKYMLWAWLIAYALVGIQMGWILRPFVGSPNEPIQFFRSAQFTNAYVHVARIIWAAITGQ